MATNKGKAVRADLAKSLIAGVQKHLATTQLLVAGSTVTAPQIAAELQKLVDLRDAVDAARATLRTKVAAEAAQAPAPRAFMSAIVQAVRTAFGSQADVLADFGLTPKKARAPLTIRAARRGSREARSHARCAGHDEREGQEGDPRRRDGRRDHPGPGSAARRATAARPRRRAPCGHGDGRDGAAHRLGGRCAGRSLPRQRLGVRERGAASKSGRRPPARAQSLKTRTAFSRRNLGHTSSRKGTFGSSRKMRSSVSPMGKYPAYITFSAPRVLA